MYDVAIIGGGVVGSALAYRLSAYRLKVVLVEKENDLAMGATRANTALIHAGFDPEPETLMGLLNVEGNRLCYQLCRDLDVEHRQTGSLVLAFSQEEISILEKLLDRGERNGCRGLRILSGREVRKQEAQLSERVLAALWAPEAGVINPWEFALAMAQVAVRNGVDLMLNTRLTGLEDGGDHYLLDLAYTGPQAIGPGPAKLKAAYVVNAAGVGSDLVHNMAAPPAFKILPTRGEYFLLDRAVGKMVSSIIFEAPGDRGKGVTVSPTIHDNFLVGPSSDLIEDREDTGVNREVLEDIRQRAARLVPSLDVRASIRNFAGIRANSDWNDFYIRLSAPRFLDLAATKSPGLTCAPSIARLGLDLLQEAGLPLESKEGWQGGRKIIRFKEIPPEKRAAFVRQNPLYGRVICRCEGITEGEIVAAMKSEIPPVSIDGVKRRAGSGMGRCQGGFCGPRVLEILARETGRSPLTIEEDGTGSLILTGETKEACIDG